MTKTILAKVVANIATLYPALDGNDNAVFGAGGVKYYPPDGYVKCRRGSASLGATDDKGKVLFHVVPAADCVQIKISAGNPSIITPDTTVGQLDDIINFSCLHDAQSYIDMINDPDSGFFDS